MYNKIVEEEFKKNSLTAINLQNLLILFMKGNQDYNQDLEKIKLNFYDNPLIKYIKDNFNERYNIKNEGLEKNKSIFEVHIKDEKNKETLRIVNYVEKGLIVISSNTQDPFKTQTNLPEAENFTNIVMLKMNKEKNAIESYTQRINCDEWFSGDYTLTKLDMIYQYNFLDKKESIEIISDQKSDFILYNIALKIKNKELLNDELFELLTLTNDINVDLLEKIKPLIRKIIPENKTLIQINEDVVNKLINKKNLKIKKKF